jgi:hypothetical protein
MADGPGQRVVSLRRRPASVVVGAGVAGDPLLRGNGFSRSPNRGAMAPVYQHILTTLTDATTPMRAKDLCHALDLGIEHTRIEGMRSKLKRLVATGLVVEDEPGLFTLPRPNPCD